ncbi:hypothetical protein ACO0LV_02435 [Pseudactinotalea sp. Z1739]|uniref:hypothetical protein n=1 Tax=Pseudactinotalea sp. Z1739 TaxID=3413028 RepID=UPI003C7D3F16
MTQASAVAEVSVRNTRDRLAGLGRSWGALGGIAAQCSQAGASFVLQILAVRLLGLEGLGVFAALYGLVIVVTGVSTGFVGDSLTVLDRQAATVRAGLQTWWLGLSFGLGLVVAAGAWAAGMTGGVTAIAFGAATVFFLLEDALRRLLMANLRFWRIVLVDMAGLLTVVLTILAVLNKGDLELVHLLFALAVGQAVAALVAIVLLPRSDRYLAPWRGADVGLVGSYGTNRAVQLSLRPGLQAATRLLGLALVSAAAVGELEASRVYMAPTLIVIGGLVSVLFAQYAAAKHVPLERQVRTADRHAWFLAAGSALLCGTFFLILPWLGPILTGGEFALSTVGLIGWAVRSVIFAGSMPFMSLAAVRGMQRTTLMITLVEFVMVLAAVVLLLTLGGSILWVPVALAGGSAVTGFIVRVWVLPQGCARERALVRPN